MRKAVKIGKNPPHPLYIPLDLVKDGFVGDVELMADAKTVTVFHPNASLEEIAESLQIVLKDVNLRRGLKTAIETEEFKTPSIFEPEHVNITVEGGRVIFTCGVLKKSSSIERLKQIVAERGLNVTCEEIKSALARHGFPEVPISEIMGVVSKVV